MKITRSQTTKALSALLAAALALLATLLLTRPVRAESAPDGAATPGALDFVLLGDPQIGYGIGGDWADGSRFRQVLAAVDASRPALAVVAGDLVQHRSFWQWWIFDRALKGSRTKSLLVAGNHDVVSEGSLASFRASYGADHYRYAAGPVTFLVLDSEVMRSPELSASEHDEQWRWFEKTLAGEPPQQRVFLVAHRPPFANGEDEPESAQNWPPPARQRLLAAMRKHRVGWFLAGHLHARRTLHTNDGITIVVEPGSARSFDASVIGYRAFHVAGDRVEEKLVKVLDAPSPPFAVPGFPGWTPRIFDFSIRHWLFTLAYVAAGALALRTARGLRAAKVTATLGVWGAIAAALFFFGANMQLDFDEAITEIGRVGAKVIGIYKVRHLITGTALALGCAAGAWWLARRFLASPRDRATTLALASLTIPTAWFCLSTISHHSLGMVLSEETWDVLTVLAFVAIGGAALVALRRTRGKTPAAAKRAG
ncbi:MAG TPA: metallophosphoesterase [Polyangiaceae bacterium]|nr:metallophosphoesterase [Polyangiaceae bacterium]